MFPFLVDEVFTRQDDGNQSTLTLTVKDQIGSGTVLSSQSIAVDRTETQATAALKTLHALVEADLANKIQWAQIPPVLECSRSALDILL